jgi:hypothetical protein
MVGVSTSTPYIETEPVSILPLSSSLKVMKEVIFFVLLIISPLIVMLMHLIISSTVVLERVLTVQFESNSWT